MKTMKAIRVHRYGGPEALIHGDVAVPEPKEGEALVKIEFAGVNFIDIYHRTGLYHGKLPFIPGMEAAGVVEETGGGVTEARKGDRVAYAMHQGSYAQYAVVPAWKLVHIPDDIDSQTASALMLQGMTAHYLTHSTYPLRKGDVALVHAAAGGVGLLLVQIAKFLGATVIGTVSTEEKARLAKEAGADHVIIYTQSDFEEEVKRLTNSEGVNAVYDSVGKTTFEKSLKCLKPRGYLVLFGQSSGPVTTIDTSLLSKRALFLTRPSLSYYAANREELLQRANDLFRWTASGKLKPRIHKTLPLKEAAEAHKLLEGRETSGKLLLAP